MTKPSDTNAIESATNISWKEWVKYLDAANGHDLTHKEIAEIAHEKIKKLESSNWWAQSVTVAYEQYIGRRQPGQNNDGTYEVGVTKTLIGTMDQAMQTWLRIFDDQKEFADIAITKSPTTSQTNKRHHWSCGLEDGSRVSVDAYEKAAGKVILSITHTKLTTPKAKDRWQTYWKDILSTIDD